MSTCLRTNKLQKMLTMHLVTICTLLAHTVIASDEHLVVRTNLGYVRGLKSTSRNGKIYTAFKGIQYGVISKRFQQAEEAEAWDHVKDTTEFGSDCPQLTFPNGHFITDENCLFLNVYVPETGKDKKPVIFYIHGGAWMFWGSSTVGEKYFMDEDVILVSMNYRLGAFGFLAIMDNKGAPGNMGFFDQLLALKWVKNNIARFGGDPDSITLMGESAGAGSVANFIVSPHTQGLFHKAILHSGGSFNSWTWCPIEDAESSAFIIGKILECPVSQGNLLLDCLLNKTATEILQAQLEMKEFYLDPVIHFYPVVEKKPTAFLQAPPPDLVQSGNFHRVPTIITACEDEGLMLHSASIIHSEEHISALEKDWVKNAGIQAGIELDGRLAKLTESQKHDLMTRVRDHYFGKEKLMVNDPLTRDRLTKFYTDRFFLHGIRDTALAMSQYTSVYAGIFTNVGADSITRIFGYNETIGLSHVDDLQFFFDEFGVGPFPLSQELKKYSEELVKVWANFALTGVPSGTVSGKKFVWPEISAKERKTRELYWINLGNIPQKIHDPYANRLKIWDTVYELFEKQHQRDEL